MFCFKIYIYKINLFKPKIKLIVQKNQKKFTLLILASLLLFIFSGCVFVKFDPKPLIKEEITRNITEKSPEIIEFKDFLQKQGFKDDQLTIKEWGLNELILGALFYNPRIEIAKKEWDVAKVQELVAPIKPLSSFGIISGRETSGDDSSSKNAIGSNFNTFIETADKANIRLEKAINQTLLKRLELRKVVWDIRIELTQNFLRYHQLLQNIKIIKNEIRLQNDVLNMLKKRKAIGISSSIDINFYQIEFNKNLQKLIEEQYALNETKSRLASTIGLSAEKFNTIQIASLDYDQSVKDLSLILDDNIKQESLVTSGLFNRIDLRIALAKYALAESQFKLNVANQYPDIRLSPAYIFDYGAGKWELGILSLIPSATRNKALAEEAKQLREIEGLQVEKLQTIILNEIQKLRDNYQTSLEIISRDKNDLIALDDLEKGLNQRFQTGEIDRLELTQELLKNLQFKRKSLNNKITFVKHSYDFETILQETLIEINSHEK